MWGTRNLAYGSTCLRAATYFCWKRLGLGVWHKPSFAIAVYLKSFGLIKIISKDAWARQSKMVYCLL